MGMSMDLKRSATELIDNAEMEYTLAVGRRLADGDISHGRTVGLSQPKEV